MQKSIQNAAIDNLAHFMGANFKVRRIIRELFKLI